MPQKKDYIKTLLADTIKVNNSATFTPVIVATGGITGDVTGSVTGTGDINQSQELTVSGAITINNGVVLLNHVSTIIEATLDAPTAGDRLFILDASLTGTAAHTVTLPAGVTFDGTNNTATFNLLGESLDLIALSATRWYIRLNTGTVALSSV